MDNPIGTFIKKERKRVGLTQVEFALRSGLGLRFVRDLEQEKPPQVRQRAPSTSDVRPLGSLCPEQEEDDISKNMRVGTFSLPEHFTFL